MDDSYGGGGMCSQPQPQPIRHKWHGQCLCLSGSVSVSVNSPVAAIFFAYSSDLITLSASLRPFHYLRATQPSLQPPRARSARQASSPGAVAFSYNEAVERKAAICSLVQHSPRVFLPLHPRHLPASMHHEIP